MTLVIDSSVVVAALVDSSGVGRWAESLIRDTESLAAPHLMPAEVANILRRMSAHGELGHDDAAGAHTDLLALPVELFPFQPLAERAWELRSNVTTYDAWYVSLAEALPAALATLDARLRYSAGPRCPFLSPPGVGAA